MKYLEKIADLATIVALIVGFVFFAKWMNQPHVSKTHEIDSLSIFIFYLILLAAVGFVGFAIWWFFDVPVRCLIRKFRD